MHFRQAGVYPSLYWFKLRDQYGSQGKVGTSVPLLSDSDNTYNALRVCAHQLQPYLWLFEGLWPIAGKALPMTVRGDTVLRRMYGTEKEMHARCSCV
jgi:hypothetical protein